jgi:hypothetical protein
MCFVEVVVAGVASVKAPDPTAHAPTDEGVLSLDVAPPELLFLFRSVAARRGPFWPLPFFCPSTPA